MLANSINAFRLKTATTQNTAHGVDVTFRGKTVKAVLSPIRVNIDLETGGQAASGEQTARFLQSDLASKPARKEQVTINGRKYSIIEVKDPVSTHGEYVVVLQTGSLI